MASPKVQDRDLLCRLSQVFRQHGYEGASLSRIAKATGLQRASLYHRFPGGKEEMADAVLAYVDELFGNDLLAPLFSDLPPAQRVKEMAKRLRGFYERGQASCLLDTMSLGGEEDPIKRHVAKSFDAWLSALAAVAREAGLTPALARRRAEDALMRFQGGLVMARATGNIKPFERVLGELPDLLTKKEDD